MSNGDDTQAYCCAAGVCCKGGGDDVLQLKALVEIITAHLGEGPVSVEHIADIIRDEFDLTPKSWGVGALLKHVAQIARTYPYV